MKALLLCFSSQMSLPARVFMLHTCQVQIPKNVICSVQWYYSKLFYRTLVLEVGNIVSYCLLKILCPATEGSPSENTKNVNAFLCFTRGCKGVQVPNYYILSTEDGRRSKSEIHTCPSVSEYEILE
jgi:hypothetical protein